MGQFAPARATTLVALVAGTAALLILIAWGLRHSSSLAELGPAMAALGIAAASGWLGRHTASGRAETPSQANNLLVTESAQLILNVDASSTILSSSPGACSAWGYGRDSLLARSWVDLVADEDARAARQFLQQACERPPGRTVSGEFRIQHADGSLHDYEVVAANELTDEATARLVLSCHDISERKAFERELTRQAFHDPLTSLPNRALFLNRVEHALARSERSNTRVAILYLDLDNFKIVNDTLGHAAGDALLLSFAERLLSCVREVDTVARLGGDEFAILLESVPSLEEAERMAQRTAEALRVPFEIEDHTVYTTASVGIALAETHARDAAALIRAADLALYRAKGDGKARYAVYDSSMAADCIERMEIENDLRLALDRGELRVYYQPIVSLGDRQVLELEALVRWVHPARGLLAPSTFIAVAEETGLIVPMGRWVLETACRQLKAIQAQQPSGPPLRLSVNVSARQLWRTDFVDDLAAILAETAIDPAALKLEITETMLISRVELVRKTIDRIRELGVKLAIDDFGTGFSSLSYIKEFPVDAIKIDRSFVEGLGHGPDGEALVRNVIELGRSLGLPVTGEGVETEEQWRRLQDLGCELGQGYLFARPLSAEDLSSLLIANAANESPVPGGRLPAPAQVDRGSVAVPPPDVTSLAAPASCACCAQTPMVGVAPQQMRRPSDTESSDVHRHRALNLAGERPIGD